MAYSMKILPLITFRKNISVEPLPVMLITVQMYRIHGQAFIKLKHEEPLMPGSSCLISAVRSTYFSIYKI